MANRLQRLLLLQHNRCFFCRAPLAEADASVDHLVARANGGSNDEGNCVACCKAVNALFDRAPLKQKLSAVLGAEDGFICPAAKKAGRPENAAPARSLAEDVRLVMDNLQTRGVAKPKTLRTLMSTIHSLFQKKIGEERLREIIRELEGRRFIEMQGTKVAYRQ